MKKNILYLLGLGNFILVLTEFHHLNIFVYPTYYIIISPIISIGLIVSSIILKIKKAIWFPIISLILSVFLFVILANTPW